MVRYRVRVSRPVRIERNSLICRVRRTKVVRLRPSVNRSPTGLRVAIAREYAAAQRQSNTARFRICLLRPASVHPWGVCNCVRTHRPIRIKRDLCIHRIRRTHVIYLIPAVARSPSRLRVTVARKYAISQRQSNTASLLVGLLRSAAVCARLVCHRVCIGRPKRIERDCCVRCVLYTKTVRQRPTVANSPSRLRISVAGEQRVLQHKRDIVLLRHSLLRSDAIRTGPVRHRVCVGRPVRIKCNRSVRHVRRTKIVYLRPTINRCPPSLRVTLARKYGTTQRQRNATSLRVSLLCPASVCAGLVCHRVCIGRPLRSICHISGRHSRWDAR